MEEQKNKCGRPTVYRNEYNEQARKLCLLGATDKELADFFEVVESTINEWKLSYPLFSESIKDGKEIADANVANRLYQRAMGYEHEIEELKIVPVGDYQSEVQKHTVKKAYPPDATSAIFWLKNRQPKKWRDKQEHSVDMNAEISVKEMTAEEAIRKAKELDEDY